MKRPYGKGFVLMILLAAILLTTVSCGSSITGSWTNSLMGIESTLQFNTDGTFTISALGMVTASGTYSVSGNQLILSATDTVFGLDYGSGAAEFSIKGDQLIIDNLVYTRQK